MLEGLAYGITPPCHEPGTEVQSLGAFLVVILALLEAAVRINVDSDMLGTSCWQKPYDEGT